MCSGVGEFSLNLKRDNCPKTIPLSGLAIFAATLVIS